MPDKSPSRSGTVLVVDDNLQNRLVAEGHLVADGYAVLLAENGKEALEVFDANSVDLVLLDIMMPVMNGFETCARLRATEKGQEVPILFLTALGDLETHENALSSGADDFLAKPIQRVELLLRVRSLVRIKQLQTELEKSNTLIRSQRDALQEAQEQKRRLTAMIVHDLKSLLAGVLTNGQLLVSSYDLDDETTDVVEDIVHSADTMHRLVMDLLDVARSEDGVLVPEHQQFDVGAFLDEVGSSVRGRQRYSKHEIVVTGPTQVVVIQCDKDLVRRVVENLVDNATKYAPGTSEIRIEADRDEGERIVFKVRDHGPGVPVEHRQKIFDQYFKIEKSSGSQMRSSRGLGLAFCRLAVEAHGGKIWVEDNEPKGSAFCFWIPLAKGT